MARTLRLLPSLEEPLVKLVICREDLPENPRWRRYGYPAKTCWDIDELVQEAVKHGPGSVLWEEARRLWWEFYHRYHGEYKRGRPLPEVYICAETCVRIDDIFDRKTLIKLLYNYFRVAGYTYGLIPQRRRIKRLSVIKI